MKYSNYKTEDFVTDTYFVKWVKDPDEDSNLFWENWILQNPEKNEIIEEAREIILFLNFKVAKPSSYAAKNIKEEIKRQINEDLASLNRSSSNSLKSNSEAGQKKKSNNSHFLSPYYQVAAVFLGLILITPFFFINSLNNNNLSYSTSYGELKTISLPDQSTVILSPNSKIEFAKNWREAKTREVWLVGEAFFSVVKKTISSPNSTSRIKFIVHTQNLDIEVLGTTFNVKNRRGKTKVVLNSGKIKLHFQVNDKENNIYMKPGELVEFSKKDNDLVRATVKAEKYILRQSKDLSFDDLPLAEIAKTIEDQYGVKVVIKDPKLAKMRFTGTTPRDNLDILYTSIANSFDVQIVKERNKIIIKNN